MQCKLCQGTPFNGMDYCGSCALLLEEAGPAIKHIIMPLLRRIARLEAGKFDCSGITLNAGTLPAEYRTK